VKIEFDLSETQCTALKEIMAFLKDKNITEQELARRVFVDFIIRNKQELIKQELVK
jgi:uncharacterized protein YeaC (DUF1315 family)